MKKMAHKFAKKWRKLRIWLFRYVLSEKRDCLKAANVLQPVLVCGNGSVDVDSTVTFGWQYSPTFYSGYTYLEARFPTSRIEIGKDTFFSNSCTLISNSKMIRIGKNCRIGYGCSFFDSDFHGLHPTERDISGGTLPDEPVNIGDNVFLGSNVMVLKGVEIGSGAVIGAGSVVTRSIPPMTIAAGNPCRVIRGISEKDRIDFK